MDAKSSADRLSLCVTKLRKLARNVTYGTRVLTQLHGINNRQLLDWSLRKGGCVEAARALAQRVMLEGGRDASAQMDFAFRSCVGRPPTGAERQRLVAFLNQQIEGYRQDPREAERLAG